MQMGCCTSAPGQGPGKKTKPKNPKPHHPCQYEADVVNIKTQLACHFAGCGKTTNKILSQSIHNLSLTFYFSSELQSCNFNTNKTIQGVQEFYCIVVFTFHAL